MPQHGARYHSHMIHGFEKLVWEKVSHGSWSDPAHQPVVSRIRHARIVQGCSFIHCRKSFLVGAMAVKIPASVLIAIPYIAGFPFKRWRGRTRRRFDTQDIRVPAVDYKRKIHLIKTRDNCYNQTETAVSGMMSGRAQIKARMGLVNTQRTITSRNAKIMREMRN